MIRQIIEKCYEYNVDIHHIFIDYTQAFDSIQRNKILDSLTQNKILSKLIRLIKLSLENTTAKVKVNNAYTTGFRVGSGIKQGDPLSPILFSRLIDTVFKKNLVLEVTSLHDSDNLTVYADDILIIAHTKQSLIDTFQQLKDSAMEV
jgi:hypothetical protein